MDVEAAVSSLGSSYETGNYGGLFKGEDVTADGCVYDPEVNNGLEKYPTSGLGTYWYNLRDTGFTYRRNDAHKDVWDGWYAALIVSKQGKTPQTVANDFAAGVAGEDDVIMGMTLEEYKTFLGKRKAWDMLKTEEERGAITRNGFRLLQAYWDKEEDNHSVVLNLKKAKNEMEYDPDREKESNEALSSAPLSADVEHTIAEVIAALCIRTIFRAGMAGLYNVFSESDYEYTRENVFRCAAKFIMSVFDKEDFLRIGFRDLVDDEYSKFNSCLKLFKCDPLVAVAEGLVKLDEFPELREHDLCDILRQYDCGSYYEFLEVSPWIFNCPTMDEVWGSDIEIVREEMQNFVRLKADRKMQLDLELLHMKGFHVLDNLVLEAMAGINFREIEKFPTEEYCSATASFARHYFRDAIYEEFYSLSTMKSFALNHFLGAVTYPLSDGCFGPSTSELLEVIKIADHERRMEGHRLISVQNLLFGLSHSRVSDCVQEILNDRGMKPSTLTTFGIYKLSRDAANLIGDAEVGLEHVVLAIFFGKQENIDAMTERSSLFFGDTWDAELLKCLRNSNTKCSVSSLTESNVLDGFLPEDCRDGCIVTCEIGVLVTKLLEALDNDWNLLAIREATRRGYL